MKLNFDQTCVRIEFTILLQRCSCSKKALKAICTPKLCFPTLYHFAFPKGGFHGKVYNSAGERVKFTSKRQSSKQIQKDLKEMFLPKYLI